MNDTTGTDLSPPKKQEMRKLPTWMEATGRSSLEKCSYILFCERTQTSAYYCFIREYGSLEVYLAFKKESALHQKDDLMRIYISAIQIIIISWGWYAIKNMRTRKQRYTSLYKILWFHYSSVFFRSLLRVYDKYECINNSFNLFSLSLLNRQKVFL